MNKRTPIETIDAGELHFDENGKPYVIRYPKPEPDKPKLESASEDEVWLEVKQRLEELGFHPPDPENPDKCETGFYLNNQSVKSRAAKGLPDVEICFKGTFLYFPLELKERKVLKSGKLGKPSCTEEQKVLLRHGCNCIVRSAADVDRIVEKLTELFAHDQVKRLLEHAAKGGGDA